jgi:hypothetical protein
LQNNINKVNFLFNKINSEILEVINIFCYLKKKNHRKQKFSENFWTLYSKYKIRQILDQNKKISKIRCKNIIKTKEIIFWNKYLTKKETKLNNR